MYLQRTNKKAMVTRSTAGIGFAIASLLTQEDWLLLFVLSVTAGALDVIGFLALDGLSTAHITGNLVVLAVHYITGASARSGRCCDRSTSRC
jgi:hypothetical protein